MSMKQKRVLIPLILVILVLNSRGIGNADEQPVTFAIKSAVLDFGGNQNKVKWLTCIIFYIIAVLLVLVGLMWVYHKKATEKFRKDRKAARG